MTPSLFRVFTISWDAGCGDCYGPKKTTDCQEEEEENCFNLRRPFCTWCSGWVASLCPCPEPESSPGPRCLAERFGLHFVPSTPSTLPDGARPGPQHGSTMGGRSSGDATVLPTEQGRAVPLDGGGRVVQIRLGLTPPMQDGHRGDESLTGYRGQRTPPPNLTDGPGQRILRCHYPTVVETRTHPAFFHLGGRRSFFTAANTTQYVDIVLALVDQYNRDVHRSIGMAPKDVNASNEAQMWQCLNGQVAQTRRRGRLKVGNNMRLSQRVKPFKKGHLPQWMEEVFQVRRVIQGPVWLYKVEEFDGTPVQGTFYAKDLQKVTVDEDMLWQVEKYLNDGAGKVWFVGKGGQASTIVVSQMSIYMTLPSNGGGKEFNDTNTNSSYKVHLPKRLKLKHEDWEVALASISYPTFEAVKRSILHKFPAKTKVGIQSGLVAYEEKDTPADTTTNPTKVVAVQGVVTMEEVVDGVAPVKDGYSFVQNLITLLHTQLN